LLVLPAIDILDGQVVRVRQGDEATAKVYSGNPSDTATSFLENGATMAHIVDLNAALHDDRDRNYTIIEAMLAKFKGSGLELQLAGGIRSREVTDRLLSKGASRIVLSSLAYSDLNAVRQILKDYGPRRIVLALDYGTKGEVRTGGWKTGKSEHVRDALSRFLYEGFSTFLLTSVAKDGMLQGPDLSTLSNVRNQYRSEKVSTQSAQRGPRLIASGGISSLKDLEDLEKLGVEEAIVGKAIYEGNIDPKLLFSKFRNSR